MLNLLPPDIAQHLTHKGTLTREAFALVSQALGAKGPKLLGDRNAKIEKSNRLGRGVLTYVMHLAPYTMAGAKDEDGNTVNVCEWASPGCMRGCLNSSGMGSYPNVRKARRLRVRLYVSNPALFFAWLYSEILRVIRKAAKLGLDLALRLNGTSDIAWEIVAPWLFVMFPQIQFYDYTKDPHRMRASIDGATWPSNYDLTFSKTEDNDTDAWDIINRGGNVAVVFESTPPTQWGALDVIEGISHDLRFTDPRRAVGFVVGLKALARAKTDPTGFTVRAA